MSDFDLMISIAKRLNDDRATLLAEIERLLGVICDAAKHWLELCRVTSPPIPWEGSIDGAMAAACQEIERLRAERDVIMREWAIETDESLDETITRNVDGWKQRALKAEADAAALRGALASVVSRHVHENNSHHPEWVAARAALARTGGAS